MFPCYLNSSWNWTSPTNRRSTAIWKLNICCFKTARFILMDYLTCMKSNAPFHLGQAFGSKHWCRSPFHRGFYKDFDGNSQRKSAGTNQLESRHWPILSPQNWHWSLLHPEKQQNINCSSIFLSLTLTRMISEVGLWKAKHRECQASAIQIKYLSRIGSLMIQLA